MHVIDLSTRTGTITDSDGLYRLPVFPFDTIRFTSIGYKTTLLIIPGYAQEILQRNLQLYADTLNLTEIIIRPYPKDLTALKKEFLALEFEEQTPINLHLEEIEIQGPVDAGMVIKGPFTALYEAISRHGKVMRQYEALIRYDKLKFTAGKRYNASIIKKITGLHDQEDLIRFMEYCNLEPEFILRVNDYDLYCAIKDCYRSFRSQMD